MQRVYAVWEDLDSLIKTAEILGVKPTPLLEYLIQEHHTIVAEESRHLFEELDDIPRELIRSISVSNRAYHIVRELAESLRLRRHTVTTAILRDTVPTLKSFPEGFPGIAVLRDASFKNRRFERSSPVGLSNEVYAWVKKRIEANEAEEEGPYTKETPTSYVCAILDAFPTQEFVLAISKMQTEGYLQTQVFTQFAGHHPVRIPLDFYMFLKDVREVTGIPLGQMLSFLVKRELMATEAMGSWTGVRLPDDIRGRWGELLRSMIAHARLS